MAVHELKSWPEFFDAIRQRRNTFEVRKNDRDYKVGDFILLRRFDPLEEKYTGEQLRRRVSYVMHGGKFGLDPDYVIMAI